jgi:hypothetical protein
LHAVRIFAQPSGAAKAGRSGLTTDCAAAADTDDDYADFAIATLADAPVVADTVFPELAVFVPRQCGAQGTRIGPGSQRSCFAALSAKSIFHARPALEVPDLLDEGVHRPGEQRTGETWDAPGGIASYQCIHAVHAAVVVGVVKESRGAET